jgi:hypothetical protein
LNTLSIQKDINIARACEDSRLAALLIQNVKNAKTLESYLRNNDKFKFKCYELAYILYQVYLPLSQLRKSFTHNDLHTLNVLLYKPFINKYITYHYHTPRGETVTFKSAYLVKLIDYGRCYFGGENKRYDNNIYNKTPDVYNDLCEESKCNKKPSVCGSEEGFSWLEPGLLESSYFTSSQEKNESQDLRLLHACKKDFLNSVEPNGSADEVNVYNELGLKINSTVYGIGIKDENEKQFGTMENLRKGDKKINNVRDAEMSLENMILNNKCLMDLNEIWAKSREKFGDMHIYTDGRPTQFIQVV